MDGDGNVKQGDIPGSWNQAVEAILRLIGYETDVARRMRRLAEVFRGAPYVANSLVGGPDEPEQLVVQLKAFDCVTLVENTLALARSTTPAGFVDELKKTRYQGGEVEWAARLHYFSDWLKSNEKRGAVRNRTRGAGSRSIESWLGTLAGLPVRRTRLHVVPKGKIHLAQRRISNGSIVAFASVRAKLDFFHAGLLFREASEASEASGSPAEEMTLCHASRSAGKVLAEPLGDFLKRNRMRGIAFAAPMGTGDFR